MKIRKDVALALATMAGALVALLALFVTIPVWFEAVVITLAAVGLIATVIEIVKARKASYDEATGKYTYKFPLRVFTLGSLILVAVTAIVLLSLKRLFGFALIPFTLLLAIILAIAILKKLRIVKLITGVVLAILVVALVGYFTSALVHSGVNLNPGISTETNAPDAETPDNQTPSTQAPNTDSTATEFTSVHLKVYMPKEFNFGEAVKVVVEGANANEFVANYGDAVSVALVSDNELAVTINRTIQMDRVEYTVNDKGHFVIKDEAAKREYTIEVIETENEIKNDNDAVVEDKPVVDIEKPKDENPKDNTTTTKPEDNYAPVVFKINAPETMVYAEPIIITLEGVNAADLKFSNEDFLSIVILSDSEVEVTLIGIVNDAGEVEFVPAAGYITVTDTASGIHSVIEIVE